MKIDIIAGARPNFIKIAPIIDEIKRSQSNGESIEFRLIHTGQHYDENMSNSFFKQLNIPNPDYNLGVGSGTQAEQTAEIMIKYEKLIFDYKPRVCLVVGDVNSTMACSIVAKKMNVEVAHVESGIRSNDLTMPEEINRMITDSITDYFFTTSKYANKNLLNLGVPQCKIFFVGNTMIDTLIKNYDNFVKPIFFDKMQLLSKKYLVLTMHRPANVDEKNKLVEFLNIIEKNVRNYPVLFPVHPRTKNIVDNIKFKFKNIKFIKPLSYLEFNYIVKNSICVITDSGGITEETTVMKIPCMTLRDNTERPETISEGTNELIGTDPKNLIPALEKLFNETWKKGSVPKKWDGKTARRIVDCILQI